MFIAGTYDWSVRSLEDEKYPVFLVWKPNGQLLGVAGGRDGLAELFIDVIRDFEAKKVKDTTFAIVCMERKGGKVKMQDLVGTMTPDGAPEGDTYPDVGKGAGGKTTHHIVVRKAGAKAKGGNKLPWTNA